MKVQIIQRVIGEGIGIGSKIVVGRVRILEAPIDPMLEIAADEIIVTQETKRSFANVVQRAAGLITAKPGLNSHAAILAVELGVPTIIGVSNALKGLKNGQVITIDTRQGCIYDGRPNKV